MARRLLGSKGVPRRPTATMATAATTVQMHMPRMPHTTDSRILPWLGGQAAASGAWNSARSTEKRVSSVLAGTKRMAPARAQSAGAECKRGSWVQTNRLEAASMPLCLVAAYPGRAWCRLPGGRPSHTKSAPAWLPLWSHGIRRRRWECCPRLLPAAHEGDHAVLSDTCKNKANQARPGRQGWGRAGRGLEFEDFST
jgi:hypothetical protein